MGVPVFKNCCFLYELRYGLLVFGYLNLLRYTLLDSIATAICFRRLVYARRHEGEDYEDIWSIRSMLLATFVLALLNFTVNVLYLVAAHKRQITKLKVVIGIWVFQLILYIHLLIVGNILNAVSESSALWMVRHVDPVSYYMAIETPAIAVLDIVFQIYILLLVRSLYISYRDDTEQRAFVDHFENDGAYLSNRNGNISFIEIVEPKRRSGDINTMVSYKL